MSAPLVMSIDGEADVAARIVMLLRSSALVQELFGAPARVFDDETRSPLFPFVRLERIETRDAGSSCVPAQDHRVTLAVYSRWGGRVGAKQAVAAIRHVFESQPLSIPGRNIVLQQVTYSDVLRTPDRRSFRGLVQMRLILEEATT